MADLTFAGVFQAVQKLTAEEKAVLRDYLQGEQEPGRLSRGVILAETEALRAAGAFDHLESLYGKYARPGLEISEEELSAYLHEIGTEWEQELDDLFSEDD